jgi:hypothetical protein
VVRGAIYGAGRAGGGGTETRFAEQDAKEPAKDIDPLGHRKNPCMSVRNGKAPREKQGTKTNES